MRLKALENTVTIEWSAAEEAETDREKLCMMVFDKWH